MPRAQTAWGGNNSVIVNESVLDSLGPGGAGSPYAPPSGATTPGAYPYPGGYSRYGGALLFPPPQLPSSTLTVPPPSAEALRAVPPLPRSADRPRATARATPAPTRQAPSQTARQTRPQPATPAAKPPPPPPQPAAATATAAAPPPPEPEPQVAATPEPAPQAETEASEAATEATQTASTANASVDDMELPPPAPLPSFSDEAEPMVPTVGLNGQQPRQTLFTGGPSPSGGLLADRNDEAGASQASDAPAAAPPPPPAPEPVTASDAEQAAPLATGSQNAEALAPTAAEPVQTATNTAQQAVATPQPAAQTQQAALTPASVRAGGEVSLPFGSTQIDLDVNQEALLTPLVDQLRNDERAAVRVQAYASGEASDPNKARRLSLQRALKVRKYFIDQGIRSVRVEVRALGMSGPDGSVDRVDVLPVQR